MGWKSTKDITRADALRLIINRAVSELSNEELEKILCGMGYGENMELPHYGYNFNVVDKLDENAGDEETF